MQPHRHVTRRVLPELNPVSLCLQNVNTWHSSIIQMFLKKRRQAIVKQELEQLRDRLWRFCIMRTAGNRPDADDLFQATALRALEKAHQFEPGTRFDNWAYTIAVSIWRNELRSRSVRLGQGVEDASETNLGTDKNSGETNIFATEVLTRIAALPNAQRMAVMLVYVEGNSYREAAEIMDIPIGTVMSRLAAARQALKMWAQEGEI